MIEQKRRTLKARKDLDDKKRKELLAVVNKGAKAQRKLQYEKERMLPAKAQLLARAEQDRLERLSEDEIAKAILGNDRWFAQIEKSFDKKRKETRKESRMFVAWLAHAKAKHGYDETRPIAKWPLKPFIRLRGLDPTVDG